MQFIRPKLLYYYYTLYYYILLLLLLSYYYYLYIKLHLAQHFILPKLGILTYFVTAEAFNCI